ncbi:MAG TPA: hypothetical protein PLA74_12280 [Syntrophales bacterium]|nr:hypothetical protein [Syntrophales bacterium]HPQ44905.1 hypothetical protein [Syntrophales bacterium]
MAVDYTIKISLDDEKTQKLEAAGLGDSIKDKALVVPMPQKNKRKFVKAFPKAILDETTGEITDFPEESVGLLIDTIAENKMLEVMHLFLMKAFKPLEGKEIRRSIHTT